jgi:hypothetical protein
MWANLLWVRICPAFKSPEECSSPGSYSNLRYFSHKVRKIKVFHNELSALQSQNAENLKQIFPEKEYRGALVPISTFMCLWANYIFSRWVCLFCWRKYVDWSWEYINRSKTHECGNWGWGRAIPRKGIYKQNCRCSVLQKNSVQLMLIVVRYIVVMTLYTVVHHLKRKRYLKKVLKHEGNSRLSMQPLYSI